MRKTAAFLVALLVAAFAAVADVEVTREINGVRSFDADKLNAMLPELDGKIIKVKFTCRFQYTTPTPSGGLAARVTDGATSSYVSVVVPEEVKG